MAYTVGQRVRVADQSLEWRGLGGEVMEVTGDSHEVRLDGHGCRARTTLLTSQLQTDEREAPLDYSNCVS